MPPAADRWDREYRAKRWDYLASEQQAPRYAAIVAMLHAGRAEPHVLDLGCGSGILARRGGAMASYTGVDFSAEAVGCAVANSPPSVRIVRADIDDWRPSRPYDVIVVNEVLYYLARPREVVRRCAAALTPGGGLVVSMYQPQWRGRWRERMRVARLWLMLYGEFKTEAEAIAVAPDGTRRWRARRLTPRHG